MNNAFIYAGNSPVERKRLCFKLLKDISKCEDIRSDNDFREYVKLIEDMYNLATEAEISQTVSFVSPS